VDGLTLHEKRARAGRLGGLQKAINRAADPASMTEQAREAFLATFGTRHVCSLGCDVTISPDLGEVARTLAARRAQRAHFLRMVEKRERDRRALRVVR
jgi:hypothetical protein